MIVRGLRKIKYEDVKNAVENNVYIDDVLFNHFSKYTMNPTIGPLIKTVLRVHWDLVEEILGNAYNLYNILTENRPEFKKLLDTREGRVWLNEICKRGYQKLYRYVFLDN